MRPRLEKPMVFAMVSVIFGLATATAMALDSDGDGVDNAIDVCLDTPPGVAVDAQGRPLGDLDLDCDCDENDFALFQLAYTGPGPFPPGGMVLVPAGQFAMGCHSETGETCYADEIPVHEVNLDRFFMSIYEVSNDAYADFLNGALAAEQVDVVNGVVYNADGAEPYCDTVLASSQARITWDGESFGVVPGKGDHPMVEVSWFGAAAFANFRSQAEGRTPCYDPVTWTCDFGANGFRLPTEAEWEYGARGGEYTPYLTYPWGNAVNGSNANYWNSGDPFEGDSPETTPVGYYDGGQTPPGADMANGFGLYDMAGNVWEWCNDWYASDYYGFAEYDNPLGPAGGTQRVLRGGSWYFYGGDFRNASRNRDEPDTTTSVAGFRLVAPVRQ